MRGYASVCPCVIDEFVRHKVFERDVLKFTIPGGMKKCIVIFEMRQDFLVVVVMYET